ncbi:dethiobiotin synthase [Fulvivirga lutea]|uniref:ATP-dependent dethiobiotin synthetase BioD n=1 Tax=Fulvivirga lutea TaxID=2810512 RepID=A0A974WF22_9BACT|nr:dethiobiotin synthase [Fulvivirga lutea]QSE97274.1 dethiobiotin synthase [Fulvivirga lutea]
MNYFVTAIGTDSGKTVISAALSLALNAKYWKPIQAGTPTDKDLIQRLTEGKVTTLPERYVLNTPASPHYAAEIDNVKISIEDFSLQEEQNLIIEGAGGCLVPINSKEFVIDLAKHLNTEVILISNNYLGSINHTLLTLEYLKKADIQLKGIIFNDTPNPSTEDIIMQHANCPCIFKVGKMDTVNAETVKSLSKSLKERWNELGW